MSVLYVAKLDYFKKSGTVDQYTVDDKFLEFLHLLQKDGQRLDMLSQLTEPLVDGDGGLGWTHSNGIEFGIARSKDAAVKHVVQHCEKDGHYDEEEMQMIKSAFGMSDSDKDELRRQIGMNHRHD